MIRLMIDVSDNAITHSDLAKAVEAQMAVRVMGASETNSENPSLAGIVFGRIVGAQRVH